MNKIQCSYLIAYIGGNAQGGRFLHSRESDDAPSWEQILSMEAQLSSAHGKPCAIVSISQIQTQKGELNETPT